ncbi:MAG: hypothetical protein DRH43_11450 [Deltaproteobacteria bacterium]|nr:MAG: hypothetical protein DRH43_11450 [Deltaproteobacteria bacterium]
MRAMWEVNVLAESDRPAGIWSALPAILSVPFTPTSGSKSPAITNGFPASKKEKIPIKHTPNLNFIATSPLDRIEKLPLLQSNLESCTLNLDHAYGKFAGVKSRDFEPE